MSLVSVDLPAPVPPMMAVTSPRPAPNEIWLRAGCSAPGYLKVTSLNSTIQGLDAEPGSTGWTGSVISGWVSRTALMRSAEAAARGTITNSMETMRKENMICMEYWVKAMRDPTSMPPLLIRIAPNQRIATLVRFMMSIMLGMRKATIRLARIALSITSALASSKRWAW